MTYAESPKDDAATGPDAVPDEPVHRIVLGDNLEVLREYQDRTFPLIYLDPPFNTGMARVHTTRRMRRSANDSGDRNGFGGHRYDVEVIGRQTYDDRFEDYLGFLEPRLREAHRLLTDDGSFYLHIDYREAHYVKILLDDIFGREQFINELIWAYDYGGRPRNRWPAKHDTIFFYVKNSHTYHFDNTEVEREPYMAPGLVGPERAARGKLPTDVWWHTIVSPTGHEKTGYPTQKPIGIVRRMIAASSRPGDVVLDFFAGSGTTGAAAVELGRRFVLIDSNPDAIALMSRRFAHIDDVVIENWTSSSPNLTE